MAQGNVAQKLKVVPSDQESYGTVISVRQKYEQEELSVPPWIARLMEISIWLAIATAALFSDVLGDDLVLWACGSLVFISFVTWALHWHHLQRSVLAVPPALWMILTAVAGLYLGVSFANGSVSLSILSAAFICFLVLVVVSGAFTESQISRLLMYFAGLGVVKAAISQSHMWTGHSSAASGASSVVVDDWAIGAFLIICALAAATYVVRAYYLSPTDNDLLYHSPINRFVTQEIPLALIAVAMLGFMAVVLFELDSIVIFPLCAASLVLFVFIMALKKTLGPTSTVTVIILLLALSLANLGRPHGVNFGFSTETLQANISNLVSGKDLREGDPKDSHAQTPSSAREIRMMFGDFAQAGDKSHWALGPFLLMLFSYLVYKSFLAVLDSEGSQSIFAAGAMTALVNVLFLALFGNILGGFAVAMTVSVMCAIASVGGEFEEEYMEE